MRGVYYIIFSVKYNNIYISALVIFQAYLYKIIFGLLEYFKCAGFITLYFPLNIITFIFPRLLFFKHIYIKLFLVCLNTLTHGVFIILYFRAYYFQAILYKIIFGLLEYFNARGF